VKAKMDGLETNSKTKNIRDVYRGISDFKKGYQPRTNILQDVKCDLVTDFRSILARQRKHFLRVFNVRGINDVRLTDIQTAEPLVPEPSAFEIELAIEKRKRHKSPGVDQIPAELIKVCSRTIHSEIHKRIDFIWNKGKLPEEKNESIILQIYTKSDKTGCSNYRVVLFSSTTYTIVSNNLLSRLTLHAEEIIGDH
jgi:hypothetical protein